MTGLRPLRPHQDAALAGLRQSLRSGHRRPMLELPTGSGKTVIAAHIVHGALAKHNRVAFIVPLLNLIDQTFERFVENGICPGDMGVIQGDHEWRRPAAPVQICSVQTLARRGMPLADVYVVDEAHIRSRELHAHLLGPDGRSLIAVGLSATPWTKGLGLVFDDLVKPVTMADLIAQGHLSPFKVFAPSHPDLSDVKIDAKSGDYQTGQLSDVMSENRLVADIVDTWLAKAEGVPTLCFAVDRAHAASIHEQFARAGVSSAYVDANTPRDERKELAKRFTARDVKVICNIGTMTTGVDLDVRCIIYARPTKSESLFAQCIGRGLRPASGKDYCLVLDHSDTSLRLGMVTELGRNELCDGKPGAGDSKRSTPVKLPRECKACSALVPPKVAICPYCGTEAKKTSDIVCEDGELIEFGTKAKNKPLSAAQKLAAMGKENVYRQLRSIQIDRRRSDGWLAHTYKAITEVWPRGLDHLEPHDPIPELVSFVRHRDIAFAKSRRREATYAA